MEAQTTALADGLFKVDLAERYYFLPGSFTRGKEEPHIRIEPKGEVARSAGEYRVLTIPEHRRRRLGPMG